MHEPGDLHRVLVRLRPAQREERLLDVAGPQRRELAPEESALLVGEQRRDVREALGLAPDRLDDLPISVPDVDAHQLAVQIQVALAVDVPEVDALGASDRDRSGGGLRRPVVHRVALGELDDLLSRQRPGSLVHHVPRFHIMSQGWRRFRHSSCAATETALPSAPRTLRDGRRGGADDEAMVGGPVQDDSVARLGILGPHLVVEAVNAQPFAGLKRHDELRDRAEVDDVRDRPRHATRSRADLVGGELDPLGAHRDLVLAAASAGVARQDRAVLAQVHDQQSALPAIHPQRDQVRGADESGDEGARRTLIQLAGGGELLDHPSVHDRDPVRHRHGLLLVVGDVDERRTGSRLQVLQLELHLLSQLQVQGAEGLVEEQGGRAIDERPGEGHALLLSPGQLAGTTVVHPIELNRLEHLPHPVADLVGGELLDLEAEGDVLGHGHVRKQSVGLEHHVHVSLRGGNVRHVGPLQQDPAGVRRLESRDHAKRGRLPAARRTEHREELTAGDGERDVVDGDDVAEPLRRAVDPDLARGRRSPGAVRRCVRSRIESHGSWSVPHVWIRVSRPSR